MDYVRFKVHAMVRKRKPVETNEEKLFKLRMTVGELSRQEIEIQRDKNKTMKAIKSLMKKIHQTSTNPYNLTVVDDNSALDVVDLVFGDESTETEMDITDAIIDVRVSDIQAQDTMECANDLEGGPVQKSGRYWSVCRQVGSQKELTEERLSGKLQDAAVLLPSQSKPEPIQLLSQSSVQEVKIGANHETNISSSNETSSSSGSSSSGSSSGIDSRSVNKVDESVDKIPLVSSSANEMSKQGDAIQFDMVDGRSVIDKVLDYLTRATDLLEASEFRRSELISENTEVESSFDQTHTILHRCFKIQSYFDSRKEQCKEMIESTVDLPHPGTSCQKEATQTLAQSPLNLRRSEPADRSSQDITSKSSTLNVEIVSTVMNPSEIEPYIAFDANISDILSADCEPEFHRFDDESLHRITRLYGLAFDERSRVIRLLQSMWRQNYLMRMKV